MSGQGVHIQFTSDHQKVMQGLAKSNAALEKQVQQLRKVSRAGKGASKSVGGLAGDHLMKFAGLTAAIALVAKGVADIESSAERGADRLRGMATALKNLIQQAGGDVGLMSRYERLAKKISAETGVSEGVTAAAVQKGIALGLSEQDVTEIMGTKVFEEAPEQLVPAVGRLRAVFGKDIADISARGILNALLTAQTPTEVGASALSTLSLEPAEMARALGGTLAESMAVTAFGTKGASTPRIGATQATQFLKALYVDAEKRFAGMGVLGAVEKFRGLPTAERDKIIGKRKEALLFSGKILDDAKFAELVAQVEAVQAGIAATGTSAGLYGKETRAAMANPRLAADLYENQRRARFDLAYEDKAISERYQEGAIAGIKAKYVNEWGIIRWVHNTVLEALDKLQIDPRTPVGRKVYEVIGGFLLAEDVGGGAKMDQILEGIPPRPRGGKKYTGQLDKLLLPGGTQDVITHEEYERRQREMEEPVEVEDFTEKTAEEDRRLRERVRQRQWDRKWENSGLNIEGQKYLDSLRNRPDSTTPDFIRDSGLNIEGQKYLDSLRALGDAADTTTEKLKKLSDAAENVTVLSEPME